MKKFLVRTFVTFSILFILLFGITMFLEYSNKTKLQEEVNVEYRIENGEIVVPDTPSKVSANLVFSETYFYISIVITLITPVLFYYFGGVEIIKRRNFKNKFIEGLVFFFLYGCFAEIVIFPKILFSSFYRLRLVGLSSQTFLEFFKDYIIGNIESVFFELPIVALIYLLFIKRKDWYIFALGILIAVSLISNYIYPYVDEIKNELVEMEDGQLKDKILALSKQAGIDDLDIKIIPKSHKTKSINAYMTGIRNSRRIVFWDTTLNQLSEKEILSVAAHEMGHYKLNHIRNSMVLGMGILLLSVFALNFIMIKLKGKNYRVIDNILVIIFISNLMTYIITPMENSYSRMIETQADEFAMEITEDPLTNGLLEVRFIESNLTPVDVKGFFKYMAYDHPTVKERIENSNRFVKNMSR
ncbi:MAG: hypothetical protein E7213_03170 [Clostridium sp.]|nr:hypothetical protein [Clostridium sp.]